MIEFDSAAIYVQSATTLRDKIARYDAVITALETSVLSASEKAAVSEYWLDDGQVKIKSIYRNPNEVAASIKAFMAIREIYVNKLNGRHIRLVDSKNFIRDKRYGR
jgi:hypothetical protein